MRAYLISDAEFQTETFKQLYNKTKEFFEEKGFELIQTKIGRNDLAYCMGCFGCWIKNPGECSIHDQIAQINYNSMNSDVVIFLCPIVFAQFSANMKNVLDRWLPNMLPFFKIRPDGSTMHTPRYSSYPKQIMLGYADNLSEEDAQLFTDIIRKHRRQIDVIIYNNSVTDLVNNLSSIELKRAGAIL